uniref:Putative longevity assurance proteins LAG1 LAC1 n=1 Tax=Moniliophthora roreri TaxID=221103 RepID=A0A0W0FJZ1_MONRR
MASKPSRRRAPSMTVLTNKIEYVPKTTGAFLGSSEPFVDQISSVPGRHDPAHHLTGPFLPQTPLGSSTPLRTRSPVNKTPPRPPVSPWLSWAVEPVSALKVLVIPLILYINWELLSPVLTEYIFPQFGLESPRISNPFASFFLLSNPVKSSPPEDLRYAKSYFDLLFIAYHIVFFSFVRQVITISLCRPLAKRFGIRKETKLDRFGEQGYAVVYFLIMEDHEATAHVLVPNRILLDWRVQALHIPSHILTSTTSFTDYPHWDMKPELKRYYLMQMSYWVQQLLVLVLGLEKPRKDYSELVAHHLVTIWLVGWSYLINLTVIGNAVYMSMDIPDTVLAFSKLLNYMRREKMKIVSFAIFTVVWTYFRHILNFYILWSVWYEYDLIPETSKRWMWEEGTYLVWWMKYQVFIPLLLLQLLNLFWYYLIMRILARALVSASEVDDSRSDDEGDGEDETDEKEKDD